MQTNWVDCFKFIFTFGVFLLLLVLFVVGLFWYIQEKIQSHLQSLRKVLAEFLDWRASEEKRYQDYLVQGVPSVLQQSEWVFGYLFFPKPLLKKHLGSCLRGILVPCKALHPAGVFGADPGQVWQALPPCAAACDPHFKSVSWHCSFSPQTES